MTEIEKVGLEIVKFMRGKYKLDEVAGMYYDTPCLKFRQGRKTIVSILCVHYTGINEEFRDSLIPHLNAVYGDSDWSMRCTGCDTSGCHCCGEGNELCDPLKCLPKNKLSTCFDCEDYPCEKATVGYRQLEYKSITSDDVTWAILPYVPHQYE